MARPAPFPFLWARAVGASELGRRERLVCFALMAYMNAQGRCRPAVAMLSEISGYGQASVYEALNVLTSLGWVIRSRTLGTNRYQGLIPDLHPRPESVPPPQTGDKEVRKNKELSEDDNFGGF